MNLGYSKRQATALRVGAVQLFKERWALERRLMRPPAMYLGTLIEKYMPCGKAGCRCHKRGGKPHGPYFYTSVKMGNRYVNKYLGKDEGKIGLARAFRDHVSAIARWRAVSREIDGILVALRDVGIVPWKEGANGRRKKRL